MRRGFTVVELLIAAALLGLAALLAIPNIIESRKHENESSAIGALKQINTSQTMYREGERSGRGLLYGDLRGLGLAGLVDDEVGAGVKQGYVFASEPSSRTPEFLWWATAVPVVPRETGDRYFATNHAGVIYYASDRAPVVSGDTCAMPARFLPSCR